MKWSYEMDHKTFYLVSQRSYDSLTGRSEEQPILEHCPEDGKCVFTEKWWYACEKVPCDTISSLDELKEALAFKGSQAFGVTWDTYRIEVQDAHHGKGDAIRRPISNEEFLAYISALPKTSLVKRIWSNLVWFNPSIWYDRQGYTWKVNHNGNSPYRVARNQLGTKVLRSISRFFMATHKVTIPLGFSVMFNSEWREPTTQMTQYQNGSKTDHNRKLRIGRLGFYRISIEKTPTRQP
jgi:hypothetical protein